ncbi:Site-specific recombinase XerD [[Luteovulum] sphaeroides subsp. megalophilum]|uniref:tyrosine-type recombinase/integrase n=1 Tax=Cereibacter sphaeroides TaxID=1063 RepID=UPI000B674503|nr:tyrosine-type recombinase/integrase [Cereibacter sphaeroides]SNT16848.1 Site-specific recombinase XerD [[Luteovulum] sphaeroides subsp. megalophilum]
MKRDLPAYVYVRKGGLLYFERRGQKSQRIKSTLGTPAFALEYAKLLNGVLTSEPTGRSFRALVKSYRASDRFRKLAPRTRADYDKVLEWVVEKLGHLPADKMQRKDVIRARDVNADTVRFANYIVQVIRILMEHAIDKGWREMNPAKGVSLLKSGREAREAWPDEMVKAYRAEASGRALLIFELCLGTGQRIGDVLAMRWDEIENGGIMVKQNKTGQRLWVPFTPALRAILDQTPRVGMTICAWGKQGQPTSYRGAADMVMKVRKKIGAESYDLHGLRYTTASELAALGCTDELIQAVTGHKSLAMVAKYASRERQKRRATEAQKLRE